MVRPRGRCAVIFQWLLLAAFFACLAAPAAAGAVEIEMARRHALRSVPNDPLFGQQWHLLNTGQEGGTAGVDINVAPYWNFDEGTGLGSGVNIAIVDGGIDYNHPDLAPNYRPELSFDFNGNDPHPMPASVDAHGTAVAGIAAARGNNGIGVIGVAPAAGLSAIRLTSKPTTDSTEAAALTFQNNNQHGLGTNHIYSNSWGPTDDGSTLIAPGPLTKAALASGAAQGRGGKGSVFVWAGGNGHQSFDNSNYDGYANSRYVIAVGATRNDAEGTHAPYSEPGANLLVNAPSSGGSLGVATTDLTDIRGYNLHFSHNGGDYFDAFAGTSAAVPQVSGAVALMLEANPDLTWRDVKHILVRTAVKNDPSHSDWAANAAGHEINHYYGFGRLNVDAAARLAASWQTVGQEVVEAAASASDLRLSIPDGGAGTFASPAFGLPVCDSLEIAAAIQVETVEVTVDVSHSYRGQLEFSLVAPSGTVSVLGTPRNDSGDDYLNWTFSTVRHWDELASGLWTLQIRDGIADRTGVLNNWSLAVYGTLVAEPPGALLMGWAWLGVAALRRAVLGRTARHKRGRAATT